MMTYMLTILHEENDYNDGNINDNTKHNGINNIKLTIIWIAFTSTVVTNV